MPVKCPICETQNPDDAAECANCGKVLAIEADLLEDVAPIDGLEQTIHDPTESATGPIPTIAELEQTMIARKDLAVPEEHVPDVEMTKIEEDPAAPERRSVDAFVRAALEGFAWAVLAGVCGKLLWDSLKPPLFIWPLALLDLLLLWDAARSYLRARTDLRRELKLEARVRELRQQLGIDPSERAA